MKFQLLESEPYGALVKTRINVDSKIYEIYHFDLPPDETGIFSAAMTMATAPPVTEPPAENVEVEIIETPSSTTIEKVRLDKAKNIAEKLNKIKGIMREINVQNKETM